jgi:WD40 repeat protein
LTLPSPSIEEQAEVNRDAAVAVQLSTQGQHVAIGLQSGSLAVFDLAQGRAAWTRQAHEKPLKLLAFAQDGQQLISGADDLLVRCWDVHSGSMKLDFAGAPLRSLYEILLSPNAHFAAARGFDGFGVLWDLQRNEKAADLFCYLFAFDPAGRFLVTAPRRQPGASLIQLDDPASPRQLVPTASIQCLAIEPAGKTIALATMYGEEPNEILLVTPDSRLRKLKAQSDSHMGDAGITALCFVPQSNHLLVGFSNGRIQQVNTQTGKVLHLYRFLSSAMVTTVEVVSGESPLLVAQGLGESTIPETRCWKLGDADSIWTKEGAVTWSASSGLGARVTSEGDVEFLRLGTGQRLKKLRGYAQGTRWLER